MPRERENVFIFLFFTFIIYTILLHTFFEKITECRISTGIAEFARCARVAAHIFAPTYTFFIVFALLISAYNYSYVTCVGRITIIITPQQADSDRR